MAKTAAERQKEYRERKKKTDPDFLKRERERAKQNRKPIKSLTTKEQQSRRERNKFYALTFREKLKRQNKGEVNITLEATERRLPCISDSTVSSSCRNVIEEPLTLRSSTSPMLVKMNFPNKKRENKALKSARDKIKKLQKSITSLKKNESKWKKKYQRTRSKLDSTYDSHETANESVEDLETSPSIRDNNLTPKSKTKTELKKLRASPNTKRLVKKKLLLTNALIEEVRCAKRLNGDKRRKKILAKIVSGNILKKYRCKSTLKVQTGVSGVKTQSCKLIDFPERRRLQRKSEELKRKVTEFLARDDVSIQLP